jgi:putative peptidoglycan lipid II flippase
MTLLARAAGFARTLVFSESVGATGVGTVYQSVNTIPNVVFEVAAGGLLAAVAVPLVAGHLGAGRRQEADQSASALLTWAVTLLLPLAVLVALTAPWLSGALLREDQAPGSVDLGTRMLVVFAPQVLLYGVGVVLTGILQAHGRFLAAALAPLLSSVVVIATYLVYGRLSASTPSGSPGAVSGHATMVLAGGTTLGVAVLSLPLLVPAWRTGAGLRPTWSFPPGAARRVVALAGAGVLALLAQQAAVVVTIWLANTRGGIGTLNVYQYVQAVYLLPYAVLAVPLATSAFPALARAEGAGERPVETLARALRGIVLLAAGAVAVLVAVARPAGQFFGRLDRAGADRPSGHASSAGAVALEALPEALAAYAPGLLGFGAAALLTRALYVRGRPAYAAAAVALGWAVAALWPLLALRPDAGPSATLRALGIASSAGMTVSALVLAVLVARAWGGRSVRPAARTLAAAAPAALLAAAAGDGLARLFAPSSLGGSVGAGLATAAGAAALYVVVMAAADRPALRAAVEWGRQRRRRR